jgi:phosphoribosyl 1,2-cyclic phosphate phosphodiesterase
MEILLLGTGAADGIPALFSDDPVSRYAREHGGKDLRTRTGALIDGILKIDLPPDTLHQMQRERLSAGDWSALIFTHTHDDHFAISEIQYALYPFVEKDHGDFTIYANEVACRRIRERYPEWPFEIVETQKLKTFEHAGYRITPFEANHKPDEQTHNLLVERDGRKLLYATDTGIYWDETFEALAGREIDLLVIECADGLRESDYEGHLNVEQCAQVVERLRAERALKAGARVVTTHHSVLGKARHCDLERALAPHKMEPGWDGMRITV